MTDEELREFVLGYCDGQIFTHGMIKQAEQLPMVFLSLALAGPPAGVAIEEIGVVWEWLREAGPRSINGYPSFLSCRIMHRDDWERAAKAIDREFERRKDIVI